MERFANAEIMKSLPFSEKLGDSLITMGLGMGITFIVLIGLMFAIMIMSRVLASKEEKKAPVVPVAVVEKPAPAVEVSQKEDPGELIAVIAAALMQCQETGTRLRIQSVRELGASHPIWYQAGMQQNMKVR